MADTETSDESPVLSWTVRQILRPKRAWNRSVPSIIELTSKGLSQEEAAAERSRLRREYCKMKMQELRSRRANDNI